jgi:conjugative transposon TraN protein
MKKLIFFLLLITSLAKAQDKLPEVHLPVKGDLHFISPEPIQYVDISDKNVEGDLPLPNVLRLRFKKDTGATDAIVTIAGEKFIAQYHLWPVTSTESEKIEIQPADMRPLDISGVGFSQPQLKSIALNLFCKSPGKAIEKTKAFGLKASLYHLYTTGDYIFIDLGYRNKTNLAYQIDDFRFKVDDKKVTKASNVQSIGVKPLFILFNTPLFQKTYRNIIVLKKMSFPGNKVLHIELSEKQLSGRVITLNVSYQDVLDADILPM